MTEPTPAPTPQDVTDAIRGLGFDPGQIRALVLTPTSAVAIAADYPEPHIAPEEAP